MYRLQKIALLAVLIGGSAIAFSACAGSTGPAGPAGSTGSTGPTGPSGVAPTPQSTPAANPASLTLTGAGSTGGFTVNEANYTGTLTAANGTPTCAGIATFSPASGTGPVATFVVTAVAPGICQIKVSDSAGNAAGEQVTVNAAGGGTPGALNVSTSSLAFTTAGQANTFTVTEANYTGNFTAANGSPSCAGIATFSPASAAGPSNQFTVTAVAAGQCQIKVTDTNGQTSAVNIIVTTTSGSVS